MTNAKISLNLAKVCCVVANLQLAKIVESLTLPVLRLQKLLILLSYLMLCKWREVIVF